MDRYVKSTAYKPDSMDSYENIREFTRAFDPAVYDHLLSHQKVSHAGVHDGGWSVLHHMAYRKRFGVLRFKSMIKYTDRFDDMCLLAYIMTCDHPADINKRNGGGWTPMHLLAETTKFDMMKLFIDFNGDRNIKVRTNTDNGELPVVLRSVTPLDIAMRLNNKQMVEILTEYFPSEE